MVLAIGRGEFRNKVFAYMQTAHSHGYERGREDSEEVKGKK